VILKLEEKRRSFCVKAFNKRLNKIMKMKTNGFEANLIAQ